MPDPVTHALIVPRSVEALTTWCGRDLASFEMGGDEHIATAPEAINCRGCARAMCQALDSLTAWVPKMSPPGRRLVDAETIKAVVAERDAAMARLVEEREEGRRWAARNAELERRLRGIEALAGGREVSHG